MMRVTRMKGEADAVAAADDIAGDADVTWLPMLPLLLPPMRCESDGAHYADEERASWCRI